MDGFSGKTTIFGIIEYPPALEYCTYFYPDTKDFDRSVEIAIKLRKIGKTVKSIDIIIATMALNRELRVVTKDSDFKRIKLVEPKLKLKLVK